MNTPKYKPGQWVTHEGKRKQIVLAGNSLYTDTPVYNFDDDPTIYPEDELSPSHKYEVGDRVWLMHFGRIYHAEVCKVKNSGGTFMYSLINFDMSAVLEARLYSTKGDLLNSLEFIDLCKN